MHNLILQIVHCRFRLLNVAHLQQRIVLLVEQNLDADNIAIDAKQNEQIVARDFLFKIKFKKYFKNFKTSELRLLTSKTACCCGGWGGCGGCCVENWVGLIWDIGLIIFCWCIMPWCCCMFIMA